MKNILLFVLCTIMVTSVNSQRFKIRQSMETADLLEEPAQIQVTIPKHEATSFLLNLGTSYRLNSSDAPHFLSKLIAEYHRNTQTDEKQNNLQLGYSYTWKFAKADLTDFYNMLDIKYIHDGVDSAHSIGGDILFSWYRDSSSLNWNSNNLFNDEKNSFFLSLFGGVQIQDIFKADKSVQKGFILRPLFTANASFTFNNGKVVPSKPIVRFSAYYTGRVDAVNSSSVEEGYTDLLKAGVDWFLSFHPIKVSLGASFNHGSDPMKSLKKQSFWLISLNFFK